jgi:peptidoglycan/xylan/chitin deacetylase (PgdA/CDA1 family)
MDTPETRLDRWLTLRVVAPLVRAGAASRTPRIPILMYHAIADDAAERLHPYFRTVTTPARFERQIALLQRAGCEVLSLAQAAPRLAGAPASAPRRTVVLTFDDGLQDFATHAWPVLERAGFGATVFVATGFVGRDFLNGRPCLAATQIRRLAAQGVEIGSHSVTHRPLGALTAHGLRAELVDSRRALEDITGRAVRSFACPYRFPEHEPGFAARFAAELEAAGYTAAVTTTVGRAAPGDDLRFLPRLPVNDADDDALLDAKLQGHYDWVRTAQWLRKRSRASTAREAA